MGRGKNTKAMPIDRCMQLAARKFEGASHDEVKMWAAQNVLFGWPGCV
jgi:hypothetical protein